MRKLYNEFFYVPKYGKVREKVMLASVVRTITIVLLCLAAISITAYAYFSSSITSSLNTIKTASFYTDVTVRITAQDGTPVENGNITPITSNNKSFRVEGLEVGRWYQFTITKNNIRNTAETGFIIVSAEGCSTTYHTQQLGVDKGVPGEYTPAITFKLMITNPTDVILRSHWGTSSFYSDYELNSVDDERYITLDEEIKMIVNGYVEPNVGNTNDEDTDETEPVEDPTTPTTDETTSTDILHTVGYGETLADIAKQYGVTAEQIAADNGIANINLIQIGQILKISVPADTEEIPPSTEATEASEPTIVTEPVEETTPQTTEYEPTEEPPAETEAPTEAATTLPNE